MIRFEIQDIIYQDRDSIIYRATDTTNQETVAIRRFFPFGQEHGGLEPDERKAFFQACKRLSSIDHPALRKIIFGDADPVDGMPYLVTEWIEGDPLPRILGNETMEPASIIELVRQALEVSIILSERLSKEAVWIDTDPHSIIVGNDTSGRGFTLGICPFKWLGTQSQTTDLSSLVHLVEELTGWQSKVVSDHAGLGLGGWIRTLRQSPDTELKVALETLLNSITMEMTPAAVETLANSSPLPVLASANPPTFTKKNLSIAAACVILLVSISFLIHFLSTPGSAIVETPPPAPKKLSRKELVQVRALEMRAKLETAAADESAQIALAKATLKKQNGAYHPSDSAFIKQIATGTSVELRGTLRKTALSSTGKSLYLCFSDPIDKEQIRAVARKSDFEGKFEHETFKKFIGKEILIKGNYTTEGPKKHTLVKINNLKQITTP